MIFRCDLFLDLFCFAFFSADWGLTSGAECERGCLLDMTSFTMIVQVESRARPSLIIKTRRDWASLKQIAFKTIPYRAAKNRANQ